MIVVDSSIALSWHFEEERTYDSTMALNAVVEHGAIAPTLWVLEVQNVLRSAERRGRISREQRLRFCTRLQQLPIAMDDETTSRAWTTTAELAAEHALTVYDAVYLELALRRRLPLASLDIALLSAARLSGLETLGTRLA
jgi:predicted nucleic acid-binding protein